jgi:hypothetical protein
MRPASCEAARLLRRKFLNDNSGATRDLEVTYPRNVAAKAIDRGRSVNHGARYPGHLQRMVGR